MGNAYIVGAVRTPGGKKDGKLNKNYLYEKLALVASSISAPKNCATVND